MFATDFFRLRSAAGWLAAVCCVVGGRAASAETVVLLQDTFIASGTAINSDLNSRQTGTQAPQPWAAYPIRFEGEPVADSTAYVSGGNLVVEQGGSARLDGLALSGSVVPSWAPLTVAFTMQTTEGGEFNWTGFNLTSTLNVNDPGSVTVGPGQFGFLYRVNTGIQMFSGGLIYDAGSTTGGTSFSFVFSGTNGGSPFAGNGTRVSVQQGSTSLGSYTLSQGFSGDLFLAFGNDGDQSVFNQGQISNLVISVPEPATGIALVGGVAVMACSRWWGLLRRLTRAPRAAR